jgi:hypothetical protein
MTAIFFTQKTLCAYRISKPKGENMENYYVLGNDRQERSAINALATILHDESLQLTVQADKRRNYFFIKDEENSNTYGQKDIDGYQFDNLERVMDAFEDYHQSCFLEDLDTRCDDNDIEFGDYDAAVGYLLTSKEFRHLLRGITPEKWIYPIGLTAEINQADLIDFAEKLLCKEIVTTMSACALVETQNMVFLSFYGVNDEITSLKKDTDWRLAYWLDNLTSAGQIRDFFMEYTSYAQLLKSMQPEVIEDFDEMGSDFYLNKAAMCFMGLNWLINEPDRQGILKEPLTQADKAELFGQIIDVFEDFLHEKNVTFENDERENSEDAAIIYGSDYDAIRQELENLLVAWNLI